MCRGMHRPAVPLLLLSLTCVPGCFCDFLSYHEDLDIRTGRVKTTNYLVFLPVWATTYDTVITKRVCEKVSFGR